MTDGRARRLFARSAAILGASLAVALAVPSTVLGHSLNPTYTSRLPLAVYLDGRRHDGRVVVRVRPRPRRSGSPGGDPRAAAPAARGASGSVSARSASSRGSGSSSRGSSADRAPARSRRCSCGSTAGSAWRSSRRSSGRRGTSSIRSRRSTTSVPGCLRRLGVGAWTPAAYPARLGRWPACIGFVGFVWLELVDAGGGPATLFIVLVGYTAFTLAMMAQFGRDTWRVERRDLHGVVPAARAAGRLRPRRRGRPRPAAMRSPAGLLEPGWASADAALAALGRGLHPLRRPLADAVLLRRIRRPRDRRRDPPAGRLARAARRGGHVPDPLRRGRGDRCRPPADRRRLPHRPLPDLPAHRRPGHPRRDLGSVPARLGPVRDGVPRADGGVAAAGPRLDRPAGGGRRRAHARRVGGPRERRRARAGGRRAPVAHPSRDPARGRDGRRSRP